MVGRSMYQVSQTSACACTSWSGGCRCFSGRRYVSGRRLAELRKVEQDRGRRQARFRTPYVTLSVRQAVAVGHMAPTALAELLRHQRRATRVLRTDERVSTPGIEGDRVRIDTGLHSHAAL